MPRLLIGTAIVIGVIGLMPATGEGKPVRPRLLAFLRTGPIAFEPAGTGARAGISATAAGRDAVRAVSWRPASPVGASLVRLGRGTGSSGTLAWLVALKPRHPVYDGRARSGGRAGNYFVAFIRARDGRFLGAAGGYSPQLAGRRGGASWGMAELP